MDSAGGAASPRRRVSLQGLKGQAGLQEVEVRALLQALRAEARPDTRTGVPMLTREGFVRAVERAIRIRSENWAQGASVDHSDALA